ncbi:MAG: tRNA pseudouridine(55) synthase TruB [Bacteroidetes bacterium 24-39-8]|nr:MAG: tRNA pseudouridine(55) synthase TruB [Sphingobacteriia bacterium 35-40-8]OYZ47265.1 MAG: tRNA pseudouridine(55) synthase TruB [Bacteroidetes bacterium 24-39-8]OZA62037.1 MAG: tRNA pseudouridine(55) synthase TruB [Sphingobacteriia bacterium 39-39-8]HQR94168.1 tRNA pseudouridine(55) synthase TruB [Sediminibacterium sp.]HQS55375.1 tRNA pseudouridine(55) synthase TruB [Sediminibacterium sp.]
MQWKQGFLDGKVLLFDKPMEWTSFDVANKVRAIVKVKKVGHAGTLDPLATGLLIICTGKYTKKINEYMGMEKEYTGTFTLGATTPTYDLESDPENFQSIEDLTVEKIHTATAAFKGNILQLPPQHSAIKKNGERLYISARKGEFVEVEPRPVTIHAFEIEKIEGALVHFKVVCSTGTYIRSLAHDFGQALGVGAYMSSLRRTRIGIFHVDDATNLIDFENEVKALRAAESAMDVENTTEDNGMD